MRFFHALLMALMVTGGAAGAQSTDEARLLQLVNELRSTGVRCPTANRSAAAPLSFSGTLAEAARQQGLYLATTGRITHTGPDGSSPRVRAASYGVNAVSVTEIIYLNVSGPVDRAVQWWTGSAIHCLVMTDARYTHAGVNVVRGPRGTAFVVVLSSPASGTR